MATQSFLFLLVIAAVAVSSVVESAIQSSSNRSCFPAERAALLSFKAGITSDPDNLLASWRQRHPDCCRWTGVTCSSRTGHVVKLDLRNNYPAEDLDFYLGADEKHSLRGQVSSSLLALRRSLRHLDLSGNILGDVMAMPEFLGSLQSLKYLNISYMGLFGTVLPQLGNLSKLVQLDIEGNYLQSNDLSWLTHLHSLEHLDMGYTDLSRVVDWVHWINALPNLVVLNLPYCNLNAPSTLLHNNLTVLEELDLNLNLFNSPASPNWFWDVTSLRSLSLVLCGLSGTFPDKLGNLTFLESFDISLNNIKGMIPGTLQNMCNLRSLSLGGNDISGDIREVMDRIPSCSWKNLQELYLMDAQLSGSVPVEIGTLTNLTDLDLSNNTLTSVISEEHLAGLMNLYSIDLSLNNLELNISSHWVPPFKLDSARFSSCNLGPQFPEWLRWQKDIRHLDISNTSLVGRIPGWFWTTFSDAELLDISFNELTGELPLSLEFMSVIELSMRSNVLTGLVPKLPRTIGLLDISGNYLSGFASSFQTPNLEVLALFSNSITGTIPTSICRLQKLQALDLSNNLFSGEIPDCGRKQLKNWNQSINNSSIVNSMSSFSLKLTTLLLSNNSFSSGFPLFLRQCSSLNFLDLAQNKFTGELPRWISEAMPRLVILQIRSNNFFGHIPVEMTGLHAIHILDLSSNNFSGPIPQYLEKFKALTGTATIDTTPVFNPFYETYSDLHQIYSILSDDSFSVVIKGQVLEYRENTKYLMSVDLSCNSLTGEIPEELSSLVGLVNLNLSSNLLSGNIPYKIDNLRSLESLDLSDNNLDGEIPQGLSDLTYLSYLNLSYNNLSGRIPSGHQLDILKAEDPASMYIGNPGLCGHPIPRQCSDAPGGSPANGDSARLPRDSLSQMDFLLGLIIGIVAGAWMIFCGLLFMKKWRYAYFGLLDRIFDRLYVISIVTWRKWFSNTGGVN